LTLILFCQIPPDSVEEESGHFFVNQSPDSTVKPAERGQPSDKKPERRDGQKQKNKVGVHSISR
jgi:hypothetical protein